MMALTLDLLQPEDLPSYKALIDTCFGGSVPLEQYQSAYQMDGPYRVYVVRDQEEVAATVTWYPLDLFTFASQPCLMFFNVAVGPAHRQKGIASEMLRQLISKAKAEGYRSISLTCLEEAEPAHRLYEHMGFRRAPSRKYQLDLTDC